MDPTNQIGYGTPDQLADMLASIRKTVSEEPEEQYSDRRVRTEARALATELHNRLDSAATVHTHFTPVTTFR